MVHGVVEDADAALGAVFHAIHRAIGFPPQRIVRHPLIGTQTDADRRRGKDLMPVDEERLLQSIRNAEQEPLHGVDVERGGEHENELVPADARQHVGRPDRRQNAIRDLGQQRVARRMRIIVVDEFEAVEIDERQGERLGRAEGPDQGLDVLLDQGPVGQAGQRIDIGALHEFTLDAVLPRDVDQRRYGVRLLLGAEDAHAALERSPLLDQERWRTFAIVRHTDIAPVAIVGMTGPELQGRDIGQNAASHAIVDRHADRQRLERGLQQAAAATEHLRLDGCQVLQSGFHRFNQSGFVEENSGLPGCSAAGVSMVRRVRRPCA